MLSVGCKVMVSVARDWLRRSQHEVRAPDRLDFPDNLCLSSVFTRCRPPGPRRRRATDPLGTLARPSRPCRTFIQQSAVDAVLALCNVASETSCWAPTTRRRRGPPRCSWTQQSERRGRASGAAAASPRRSAQLPPTALLRYTAALLRSVSPCYVLPALHRAASLLRCCRADSLLPLYSPSPSRMRLNQSLLDLEHSKTCSASCWSTCFLQHRCFLCVPPCCTAPSVSTVQSACTLTSWGSSRSQERITIMIRMMVSVSVSVSVSLSLSVCLARFLQSRMVESKTTLCFVSFGWLLV